MPQLDHEMEKELEKIRRYGNGLPAQARAASMLQAIESTLEEHDTTPSPTAYFAALISTIDSLLQREEDADDEDGAKDDLVEAALYVLAAVAPFVPSNVLRAKSDEMIDLLAPILLALTSPEAETTDAAALKSLLTIMQSLYVALSEKPKRYLSGSSARPETTKTFNGILLLLADGRPKVRRKAQELVWAVVFSEKKVVDEAESSTASKQHPYADRAAEYVVAAMEDAAKTARQTMGNPKKSNMHDQAIGTLTSMTAFVKGASARWPRKVRQ